MNILGFGALGVWVLVFPAFSPLPGFLGTILFISIPISFAQWIALRRILPISILWILSIPIGLLLYVLILRVIPDGKWQFVDDESVMALTAVGFMIGLLIGIPQWLLMRHQLTGSSIWLLGSSVGVAGGFWLILATDLINQSPIASYIVAGIIYVVVTGLILSRLFAKHQTNVFEAT
jgi:hypothetical protein